VASRAYQSLPMSNPLQRHARDGASMDLQPALIRNISVFSAIHMGSWKSLIIFDLLDFSFFYTC
jgi:hypothetical protein